MSEYGKEMFKSIKQLLSPEEIYMRVVDKIVAAASSDETHLYLDHGVFQFIKIDPESDTPLDGTDLRLVDVAQRLVNDGYSVSFLDPTHEDYTFNAVILSPPEGETGISVTRGQYVSEDIYQNPQFGVFW